MTGSICPRCLDEFKRRMADFLLSLAGQNGAQALQTEAYDLWRARHGKRPTWAKADYVALAEAISTLSSADEFRAAWKIFIADRSDYFAGHSPRKFRRHLDRFRTRLPVSPGLSPDAGTTADADRAAEWERRFHAALDEAAAAPPAGGRPLSQRELERAALRALSAQGITPGSPWGKT